MYTYTYIHICVYIHNLQKCCVACDTKWHERDVMHCPLRQSCDRIRNDVCTYKSHKYLPVSVYEYMYTYIYIYIYIYTYIYILGMASSASFRIIPYGCVNTQ